MTRLAHESDRFDFDFLFDHDHPTNPGGFDLGAWAKQNDESCAPHNGGLSNPTSMAALCSLSEAVIVKHILPTLTACGSAYAYAAGRSNTVYVAGSAAIEVAAQGYMQKLRSTRRASGKRNTQNLVVGAPNPRSHKG